MAEILPLRPSEHESVHKLLPWFVNGTLSERETARVETHLAECEECREDLAFERELARGVATLPLNADDGWKAMQLRMAEAPPESIAAAPVRLLRRRVPVGWAMAGSLAASVALVVMISGVRPSTAPQQTYHTLGSSGGATDGQMVVLFKPDTTEQEMRVILSAQSARLVDGPTAAGAYVVHVDDGDPSLAIKALRESSQVVLAEPLANDGRP
jgi:hypothetical protein